MKLIKKILNRYNIVSLILLFVFFLLSFRLATLTIAQGDYYRDLSDNKRLKEVYTTAPRGEIRDRYGRLLAGNKPSFTVQLLKDELNIKDKEVKNEGILNLIRLLEEDGASYIDEYPLELNVFKYKTEDDYMSNELTPINKVVEIIIDNNLLDEVLNIYYINGGYDDHYQFISINRAINALKNKGIEVPINAIINNDILEITFDESKNVARWKEKNNIPESYTPVQSVIKLIDNDKTIIRKVIDHPISRLMVFNLLNERGLSGNLKIEEYTIKYSEEFLNQKRSLMKKYDGITLDSSAKDDFVIIFNKVSLSNFLDRVISKDEDIKNAIIPGSILIDMLEEKGIPINLTTEISNDNKGVIYRYSKGQSVDSENPKDFLIKQSIESGVLQEFLSMDIIRPLAQEQLLNDGVNPKISISNGFEYSAINSLNNFYTDNKIKDEKTVEEVFDKIRDNYGIKPQLSRYEIRSMLSIYHQLSKQGYLAYQPINIAYGIKESTVARIKEGLVDMPGVNVSIEPVRYYPEGTTAAHILGYLGKISQANEIQKYVVENKYSPNAIIGKTGIEESYEDMLSGQSGIKRVEVDVVGNTTEIIEEIKPVPGDNVYLSMDLDVQKEAEAALQQTLEKIREAGTYESKWGNYKFGINKSKRRPYINATSGALVAIEVKTGQVIAMADFPSYDPNLFSTGISDTDWESLFPEDETNPLAPRPLYNIATQTAVQPGSTFKMVTALAALDKGLNPNEKIRDMGYVSVGSKDFRCLIWTSSGRTHGYENVYEALRDSCNYYFYSLAFGRNPRTNQPISVRLEIEDIVELSKKLGLNDKTGIEINIPSEVSGGVPNPQRKIINTKYLLKQLLNKDLGKYVKEGMSLSQEETEHVIEEIVSWTELETTITRGEVIKRLDSMGIDPEKRLPGDREGLADKIKYTYLNQAGWNITDTLNVTIGQGQSSYTPIQMANYIATIANGGYRHKLTLIDNIKNYNNTVTNYEHKPNPERIELNNYENLDHVKKGMEMVSSEGTAKSIFKDFPVKVAVKTGTAQRSGVNPSTGDTFDEFAWFVGFAPYEDPEIAVAAVIFQGGSGGYAGPMVRDVIAEYLGLNKTESQGNLPHENILINE
jgi:penicillin-binding protein 2